MSSMDGLYVPRLLRADEHPCLCVSDHNPNVMVTQRHHIWPKGMGGPDSRENIVPLCGTAHDSVHYGLWPQYEKYKGTPPWDVRRKYGKYIRDLTETGWRWREAGEVGERV